MYRRYKKIETILIEAVELTNDNFYYILDVLGSSVQFYSVRFQSEQNPSKIVFKDKGEIISIYVGEWLIKTNLGYYKSLYPPKELLFEEYLEDNQ